jgi:hypothetical protein
VPEYRNYRVSRRDKEPMLRFVLEGLEAGGCRVLHHTEPDVAPFRITFETPEDQRLGIVVYAFFANSRITKNRPDDEHRFQVKYGLDDKKPHRLWQDPFQLYTTLFCGIDPERGLFVGADPVLHSPTRFFISVEYKEQDVEQILRTRWHSWERNHRADNDKPVEVLVGGTADSFLHYVRFESEALGEDQGHRMLLAERLARPGRREIVRPAGLVVAVPGPARLHALAREFEMGESEVLDLIAGARRLKMAVRGWVAEEHLVRRLQTVPGVANCLRVDDEGGPDVNLNFEGKPLTIECKNVLRQTTAQGVARVDFQRTRASIGDPCSRYYGASDFDVIAACLHSVTEKWEFKYVLPGKLDAHLKCRDKISNNVKVDARWSDAASDVLRAAAT